MVRRLDSIANLGACNVGNFFRFLCVPGVWHYPGDYEISFCCFSTSLYGLRESVDEPEAQDITVARYNIDRLQQVLRTHYH